MLTKKQYEVLKYIQNYIGETGYAPTYSEIAEGIGVKAKGPITKHINALESQGYLTREANAARGLSLSEKAAMNDTTFPLVGRIAAGLPLEAFEDIEHVDLNQHFSGQQERFLLQVNGESMQDCGILDGDWVLIEKSTQAQNGEIVVALVDNAETTLKRFYKNPDKTITLVPENQSMQPFVYSTERVQIQGVLVAQMRTYHQKEWHHTKYKKEIFYDYQTSGNLA